MQGQVKFFSKAKGFGFIVNEGGEFFFHIDHCLCADDPKAGDEVEFWLDDGRRGDLVAVDVSLRDI
jgi:CspA family cold shock protein